MAHKDSVQSEPGNSQNPSSLPVAALKVVVLIATRLASTRLSEKSPADIHDEPMTVDVRCRVVATGLGPDPQGGESVPRPGRRDAHRCNGD